MSALTSLLVRDRIVPVSKIEEALQAQVLSGGDIDTVLLEMDLLPEDVLSAYRAALFGLLPATRDEVMRAPREAVLCMPREVARHHNVVPLLLDGRAMVVAAIEPLSEEDLATLRERVGYEVSARIVTRPRLSAGLAHHYGLELAPRTRRLVDALRRREPGIIPYVRPPSPSLRPSTYQGYEPDEGERMEELAEVASRSGAVHGFKLSEPGVSVLPAPGPAGEQPFEVELVGSPLVGSPLVDDAAAVAASQAEVAGTSGEHAESNAMGAEEVAPPSALGTQALDEGEERPSGVHAVDLRAASDEAGTSRALLDNLASGLEVGRATTLPPTTLSAQIANAARGPISSERASELFLEAVHRDDALYVLLRYAQQFFDFVGIFSVGKEGARGRMAHGAGLSQELMEHLVVPTHGAGLFARTVRDKRPLVGDFTGTDEERAAAALLGVPAGRPVLVVPVLIRNRVVLLLHAEREGIVVEDAASIQEVVPGLRDALQRIILQNKTLGRASRRPGDGSGEGGSEDGSGSQGPGSAPHDSSPQSFAPEASQSLDATVGPAPERDESAVNGSAFSEGAHAAELADGEHGGVLADADRGVVLSEGGAPHALGALVTSDASADSFEGQVLSTEAEDLTAVDLDAVSQLGRGRRRDSESHRQVIEVVEAPHEARAPRDGAWGRLPGVPRSAPPPPRRDSTSPAGSAGSYRYVATSGLAAEKVHSRDVVRVRSSQPEPSLRPPVASVPRELGDEPRAEDAPPSSQASAPPRPSNKRLSLVTPDGDQPSVIIDMGDQVDYLVEALMRAPAGEEPPQVAELLRLGESALPVLIQHFPGPLWLERGKLPPGKHPRGRDVSGVARALCAFGEKAAPYIAGKLASSDDDTSYYLLLVAGEVIHPDLLDAVARRALGADNELRQVALEVLRRYVRLPQFAAVLRALADLSERPGKDGQRQLLAVQALGHLRDARALPTLLARLSDGSDSVARAAHQALVDLTAQDFGSNPRRWDDWAEQNAARHRVEWLIDSLMNPDSSLRALAGEELKNETQQYFGYHPGLPKRDRELAQRKYREWWQEEGKKAFR